MSNISALRLQHEHPSDLSGQMPDLTHGFTMEAWVRPAPMDQSVRLYPQPGYGGAPVRLKEGLYRRMAADHLPQLGSACLPEDMEAVFFSEPDFQGDALAMRQDLPQAPDSHAKIGSVVVLDRSHRRQNHVVLFSQAGYQGKADVLILPGSWQRPDANDAEQQVADQKPGLAQVGSAWVPPGVALEVTQLRTSAVAGSSAITIENWTCASPVRTVFIQSADGSVEARAVLNSTSSLPVEWGINVQASQPVVIPENNILFLFEKAGFEGKETIMAGKHLGQPSLPTPIGSAIYVAVKGAAGVIGIGPKSHSSGEPPIRFFAVGDPLPADAINWHFWVPPDFCLVPGRDEAIPDRIGSGLQACPGGASYIVKRTTGTQPQKEMSGLAAGIQRVARPPDQPKTREGQGIYRLADGRWAPFDGPGQNWLQNVPDIAVVNVPKQRALFLFRKPIAQVETIADYEILADGVFDLRGLTWQPQAAIFAATPHGSDGVLSYPGQVIPVDRAVRSSANRSVWVPPGFEMIREQREWGSGFHEHIAVAGHRVAQLVRSTLQGDSADFPADARLIKTRRAGPLAGEELVYTTRQQPDVEVRASYQFWGSTNDVPDFRTVHVPEGGALFLFEEYFAGSYQGRIEIVTGSRSDLGALSWTPKLAAFAAAPAGPDGILCYQPALRVFAPGTSDLPAEVSVWFPKGYRVSDRIDPAYLRYISGQPDGSPVGLSLSDVIVERFAGILSSGDGYGLTIERTQGELRGAGDELRFGGELLRPDRWHHLAQTWDSETEILQWYLNGRPVKQAKLGKGKPASFNAWVLGRSFRGAIAQVRVWNSARTLEQIRDDRYPTTTPAAAPALDLFAQGFEAWQAPPEAVVVSADLPAAPADSVFVKRMQQQVEVEHHRNLQAAQKTAAAQMSLARQHAQRQLALAREQARREIHIQGIKLLGFIVGKWVYKGAIDNVDVIPTTEDTMLAVDVAMDSEGNAFKALVGAQFAISAPYFREIKLSNAPLAIAIDSSGTHPEASQDGKVRTAIYWAESDGSLYRAWYSPDDAMWPEQTAISETERLLEAALMPPSNARTWDMAIDSANQRLFWTNGYEVYSASVNSFPTSCVCLPHAACAYPLAVATAPDGAIVYLDAEREMVCSAPYMHPDDGFVAPRDLYPAPRPGRGVSVSMLKDSRGRGEEAAFVYWVSARRQTLEVAVLDTRGAYLDVGHEPLFPRPQSASSAEVVKWTVRANWEDAANALADLKANTKVIAFGDPTDAVLADPARLNLGEGWTAAAELIWGEPNRYSGTGGDILIYELATFGGVDRLVCSLSVDGFPKLYIRSNGRLLCGQSDEWQSRLARDPSIPHRVNWTLDSEGRARTYVDGELYWEQQFSWQAQPLVFESHRLGSPDPQQTLPRVAGAKLHNDDPLPDFQPYMGKIVRFVAWNRHVSKAVDGWSGLPGPDPTWARSLVTVESKRRYLHAGRLDGQEPPLTLFPIELDGGLNIETALDQAHAELTLAHAQKAAAEEQAAHLKAVALQDAHAKLEAATQTLGDTQAKAAADVAAAQAQADRDKAAARDRMSDADAQAERDRVQGKQDADQYKADNETTARDMETRAADDNRARIADANQRRAGAQRNLDERR